MAKTKKEQIEKRRRLKLLQQIREEKSDYIRKQCSKNPYYILLRFFGASWSWYIRELNEMEEHIKQK